MGRWEHQLHVSGEDGPMPLRAAPHHEQEGAWKAPTLCRCLLSTANQTPEGTAQAGPTGKASWGQATMDVASAGAVCQTLPLGPHPGARAAKRQESSASGAGRETCT